MITENISVWIVKLMFLISCFHFKLTFPLEKNIIFTFLLTQFSIQTISLATGSQ